MFQYFIRNNKTYRQKDSLDLCIYERVKEVCNRSEPLGEYTESFIDAYKCMSNITYSFKLKIPIKVGFFTKPNNISNFP